MIPHLDTTTRVVSVAITVEFSDGKHFFIQTGGAESITWESVVEPEPEMSFRGDGMIVLTPRIEQLILSINSPGFSSEGYIYKIRTNQE